MKKFKLTIITICFNSEKTIEKTLQSIVSQLNEDVEYIVVDGGSTDETIRILEKYKISISTLISEPDDGISDAFNKGINLSNGRYIGLINSDDELMPGAIKKILFEIQSGKFNIYCFSMIVTAGRDDRTIHSFSNRLNEGMYVAHPATFVEKHVYQTIGTFDNSFLYAMDYDFLLRAKLNKFSFSDIKYVTTKMSSGGISDRHALRAAFECIRSYKGLHKSTLKSLLFGVRYFIKRTVFRLIKGC